MEEGFPVPPEDQKTLISATDSSYKFGIYPPGCLLRKAALTLSSVWPRRGYTKGGAQSWREDTSTIRWFDSMNMQDE